MSAATSPPVAPTRTNLYQRIYNDSYKRRILFRVYDATSASSLQWDGTHTTSGFSALNPNLQALTPTVYSATHGRLTGDAWLMGPHARMTIVNHILNKHSESTFADDQSPWISTTSSIDWAIWEVARRLAQTPGQAVHIALIRQAHVNEKADSQRIQSRDEVRIDPVRILGKYLSSDGLSTRERSDILNAKRRAEESSEVLYYGRVFSQSVEADYIVTRDVRAILNCLDDS
jgi:hypothetical protein